MSESLVGGIFILIDSFLSHLEETSMKNMNLQEQCKTLVDDIECLKIYLDGVQQELAILVNVRAGMWREYNDDTLEDLVEEAKSSWEEEIQVKDKEHSRTMGLVDISLDLLTAVVLTKSITHG